MTNRPLLVGINHVAVEVRDLDEAIVFFSSIFALRGVEHEPGMAFIDVGDQFIALSEGKNARADTTRHFGLVVDDKAVVRAALEAQGVDILPGGRLDFRDPSGNRIQVVDYRDIQFSKTEPVLRGMGLGHLRKRAVALKELSEKGLSLMSRAGAILRGSISLVVTADALSWKAHRSSSNRGFR